ncbi:MAG: ATP-binding cassette domain-containing protein [Cyanobium sp. ELA507]
MVLPSGLAVGLAPLLELRNVAVPGRGAPRLADVSLAIRPGERVALLGPSGAGKSTLLAVANGHLKPEAGQVCWQGEPPARSRRARRRQQARIGTLWQDLRLIEQLSVQQNLNAGRLAVWGWPRALLNLLLPLETAANAEALDRVDLAPELLGQPVAALSGGQRQRVAVARLLRQNPTLLLADEPLASLDPRLAASLLELLLAEATAPRALLLSLHRPDLLEGFDRVIALRAGRVVFDGPAATLAPPTGAPLLERLYRGEGPALAPPAEAPGFPRGAASSGEPLSGEAGLVG